MLVAGPGSYGVVGDGVVAAKSRHRERFPSALGRGDERANGDGDVHVARFGEDSSRAAELKRGVERGGRGPRRVAFAAAAGRVIRGKSEPRHERSVGSAAADEERRADRIRRDRTRIRFGRFGGGVRRGTRTSPWRARRRRPILRRNRSRRRDERRRKSPCFRRGDTARDDHVEQRDAVGRLAPLATAVANSTNPAAGKSATAHAMIEEVRLTRGGAETRDEANHPRSRSRRNLREGEHGMRRGSRRTRFASHTTPSTPRRFVFSSDATSTACAFVPWNANALAAPSASLDGCDGASDCRRAQSGARRDSRTLCTVTTCGLRFARCIAWGTVSRRSSRTTRRSEHTPAAGSPCPRVDFGAESATGTDDGRSRTAESAPISMGSPSGVHVSCVCTSEAGGGVGGGGAPRTAHCARGRSAR